MEIPWVIPKQTIIKHELLNKYIGKWMAILYNHQKRYGFDEVLVYVDGFAGPGEYWEDDNKVNTIHGSPCIVANYANHFIAAHQDRRFIIIGIDENEECVKHLFNKLQQINIYNQHWICHHSTFEDFIPSLIDFINSNHLHSYPIFVFIDPFGYTGFSLEKLKDLLKYDRIELFINFNVYDINRFLNEPSKEKGLNETFGCKDYKKALSISNPQKRYIFLKNLYCHQLLFNTGAQYVMPFRINTPNQGRRVKYYLIHVSKHYKALKEMKDAMFKISDSDYRFECIGLIPRGSKTLFGDPDQIELKTKLLRYCKLNGSYILFENIEKWAYINTNGVSKTIKSALIELENANQIQIKRRPSQRTNTVTKGAGIRALED